jgi:hypothetical protein
MLVKDGLTATWEPYKLEWSWLWDYLRHPLVHLLRMLIVVFHMVMAIFEKPAIP